MLKQSRSLHNGSWIWVMVVKGRRPATRRPLAGRARHRISHDTAFLPLALALALKILLVQHTTFKTSALRRSQRLAFAFISSHWPGHASITSPRTHYKR